MRRSFSSARPVQRRGSPSRLLIAASMLAMLFAAIGGVHAQTGSPPADLWPLVTNVMDALDDQRHSEAMLLVEELEARGPEHPGSLWARGRLAMESGEYERAVEALDAALDRLPEGSTREAVRELRDLSRSTAEVVEGFASHTTPDGHFVIRYDASRDEVLIPWIEVLLERAFYEIGYSTGAWPSGPIRVEIYPHARTLARVSSLSEEAVEASGTIALCKYNKLMFTSPRATARGYDWRDTVAHEYVHYAVASITGDSIPIWLHEGIAKYLEGRWSGGWDMRLDPWADDLLGRRIAEGNLITFEQMHPSIAYMPTQEDASTAYAEVFTVMEYIVERRGRGAISALLSEIASGVDVETAVGNSVGTSFETFQETWMVWLRRRPRTELPSTYRDEIELRPESAEDEAVDELSGVDNVEARDFLRLGELLRARGHTVAALEEYRRAEALLGRGNPVLQNAIARCLLDLDRPQEAVDALSEVSRWFPDYYMSHLLRGEALLDLGDPNPAMASLDEAVGINPFDPAVHEQMARGWDLLGNPDMAARARRFAGLVRS